MTRTEILALPPGPELDGLIDELVFGIDRTASKPWQILDALLSAQIGSELCIVYEFGGDRYVDDKLGKGFI